MHETLTSDKNGSASFALQSFSQNIGALPRNGVNRTQDIASRDDWDDAGITDPHIRCSVYFQLGIHNST